MTEPELTLPYDIHGNFADPASYDKLETILAETARELLMRDGLRATEAGAGG